MSLTLGTAPKTASGIDVIDSAWGGLYRGGSYLVGGRPGAGHDLAALAFLRAGLESGEGGLWITPTSSQQARERAARIGLDLERASGSSRFSVVHRDDRAGAEAVFEAIVAAATEHGPAHLVVDDLSAVLRSADATTFHPAFVDLLRRLDTFDVTAAFVLTVPAGLDADPTAEFMLSQMTGAIQIEAIEGDPPRSTERRIRLLPNIGHIRRRVVTYASLPFLGSAAPAPRADDRPEPEPEAPYGARPFRARSDVRPPERQPERPFERQAERQPERPREAAPFARPVAEPASGAERGGVRVKPIPLGRAERPSSPGPQAQPAAMRAAQPAPSATPPAAQSPAPADRPASTAQRPAARDLYIAPSYAPQRRSAETPARLHTHPEPLETTTRSDALPQIQPGHPAGTPAGARPTELPPLLSTPFFPGQTPREPRRIDYGQGPENRSEHWEIEANVEAARDVAFLAGFGRGSTGTGSTGATPAAAPREPGDRFDDAWFEAPPFDAGGLPAVEPTLDRDAFGLRVGRAFLEHVTDDVPFLLIAIRMDEARSQAAGPFDFEILQDLIVEQLRPDDALVVDPEHERLAVLLHETTQDQAPLFFSRLKSRLRSEMHGRGDHLLQRASAIVAPNGEPFESSQDFVRFALGAA